nr:GNAT family N-acetyltransferase [Aquabacterium terrae]
MDEAEFVQLLRLPQHYSHALADEAGSVVGFGQVWINPAGRVNLVRVLVDPARRGQGIGRRLCALLFAEAQRHSADGSVWLRVRRDNAAAISVYRALGFEVIEIESNDVACSMRFG